MKKSLIIGCTAIFIFALLLAACQPASETQTPAGEEQAAPPTEAAPAAEELGGVLRVLNWQGYGSDEAWALEQFEQTYGVKVEHDYITSEEELLTKIRTSPGVYDVALPNIAYLQIAMEEGLMEPIDTAQLENWDALMERFKSLEGIYQGEAVYGIPWVWGSTGVVYNPESYPDGIDSFDVFWDPAYAGKIGWWDSFEDSTVFVGIAMGDKTPYEVEDMSAVNAKMLELMPNVRTLWTSEDEFDRLWANGDIDLGIFWSGSAARAKNVMGLNMEYVIPQEGAIGWIDTWTLVKDAPNKAAAYKFIDYMLSSDFYIRWDTEVGAPAPTSQESVDLLPEDAFNRAVMGDEEVVARLFWMETLTAQERQDWNQNWEEVKAAQ
jgi:spermidine/putrescine transport system substrate-binding protein